MLTGNELYVVMKLVSGENVDELALGLVTPLQTDDACAGHGSSSSRK